MDDLKFKIDVDATSVDNAFDSLNNLDKAVNMLGGSFKASESHLSKIHAGMSSAANTMNQMANLSDKGVKRVFIGGAEGVRVLEVELARLKASEVAAKLQAKWLQARASIDRTVESVRFLNETVTQPQAAAAIDRLNAGIRRTSANAGDATTKLDSMKRLTLGNAEATIKAKVAPLPKLEYTGTVDVAKPELRTIPLQPELQPLLIAAQKVDVAPRLDPLPKIETQPVKIAGTVDVAKPEVQPVSQQLLLFPEVGEIDPIQPKVVDVQPDLKPISPVQPQVLDIQPDLKPIPEIVPPKLTYTGTVNVAKPETPLLTYTGFADVARPQLQPLTYDATVDVARPSIEPIQLQPELLPLPIITPPKLEYVGGVKLETPDTSKAIAGVREFERHTGNISDAATAISDSFSEASQVTLPAMPEPPRQARQATPGAGLAKSATVGNFAMIASAAIASKAYEGVTVALSGAETASRRVRNGVRGLSNVVNSVRGNFDLFRASKFAPNDVDKRLNLVSKSVRESAERQAKSVEKQRRMRDAEVKGFKDTAMQAAKSADIIDQANQRAASSATAHEWATKKAAGSARMLGAVYAPIGKAVKMVSDEFRELDQGAIDSAATLRATAQKSEVDAVKKASSAYVVTGAMDKSTGAVQRYGHVVRAASLPQRLLFRELEGADRVINVAMSAVSAITSPLRAMQAGAERNRQEWSMLRKLRRKGNASRAKYAPTGFRPDSFRINEDGFSCRDAKQARSVSRCGFLGCCQRS